MRWRLELGGKFERFVDADYIRQDRINGQQFVSNGVVVFTISPFVYVRVTPVPTLRLSGGPRDGQVAAAPDGEMPFNVFFLPVVPLNDAGEAIAPVPPGHLAELAEVYVHLPSACECWDLRRRRPVFEHTYVWSLDSTSTAPANTGEPEHRVRELRRGPYTGRAGQRSPKGTERPPVITTQQETPPSATYVPG